MKNEKIDVGKGKKQKNCRIYHKVLETLEHIKEECQNMKKVEKWINLLSDTSRESHGWRKLPRE